MPHKHAKRHVALRGTTLVEMMVVLGIAGIIAGLSLPSMQSLINHYRAVEATRQVLLATAQVRALAQKRGEPVLMLVKSASKIEAHIPEYPTASAATDILRRVTLFKFFREFPVGGAQLLSIQDATGSVRTAGNAAAWVVFCPSGDAHFVYDSSSLPICGVGDLASHSGKLQFVANSEAFHIYIRQALGTVNLVTGI